MRSVSSSLGKDGISFAGSTTAGSFFLFDSDFFLCFQSMEVTINKLPESLGSRVPMRWESRVGGINCTANEYM